MNIAKLTDWALRLDHPPWTASKGRGKQRFRRILTPLDISCRCCPYRYNECHLSRYKFFGRVYPKVMPKRCILEDLCEGDGEILRTRCERRLRTKGERLMQFREVGRQNHAIGNVSSDGRWGTVAEGTVPDNRYGDSIPRCAPCWDIRKRVHAVLRRKRPVLRNKISLHHRSVRHGYRGFGSI